MVVSDNSNLSVTNPVDYKNGLVEAYFDTSGGELRMGAEGDMFALDILLPGEDEGGGAL